jgi:hypothetical protein
MTIARIIAITAARWAQLRKLTPPSGNPQATSSSTVAAYWVPLACTVMGSGNNTYALYGSATPVPLHTPIKVLGRRTGNVGSCWGTQVQVTSWKPNPKINCMWR